MTPQSKIYYLPVHEKTGEVDYSVLGDFEEEAPRLKLIDSWHWKRFVLKQEEEEACLKLRP